MLTPVDRVPAMSGFVPAPDAKGSVGEEVEGGQQARGGWFWVRQREERPGTWQAWPLLRLDPGCQGSEMTWPDIGVCQFQIREALVVRFSLPVQPGLGILYIPLYKKPRVMLAFSLGPFPPCNYHHTIHHAQNNIFHIPTLEGEGHEQDW